MLINYLRSYLNKLGNIQEEVPKLEIQESPSLLELNREAKKYTLANKQLYPKKHMEDIIVLKRMRDIREKHPYDFHVANQIRLAGLIKTQEDREIHLKEL